MNRTELLVFADAAALAQAAAEAFAQALLGHGPGLQPFSVALSGGRIARQFLAALAGLASARGLTWQPVHFFWADERCVPPHDPESNFALARDTLLTPLGIGPEHSHRIRGELPPETAAAEAEAELRRVLSAPSGQPVLDLVLLGMGEDGHVASLFPGEGAAALASPAVYRAVVATKPPPQRITLGYPVLSAARQVWVLISGPGKAGALRASRGRGAVTPLGRVLAQRPHTRLFVEQTLV